MGPYQAVFVDFDGTLVDSIGELYGVYCDFLAQYGKKGTPEEFQELNGPAISQIIDLLSKRYALPHPSEELKIVYFSKLHKFYAEKARPLVGAVEWLDQASAYGLKLGIVTAARHQLVEAFLQQHHLKHYFQAIVTSEQVDKGKPDPAIYKLALRTMGVASEKAIAIEDAPSGVQAAQGAGVPVIWLNPGAQKQDIHEGVTEVRDWNEIKHLFSEWYGSVSGS